MRELGSLLGENRELTKAYLEGMATPNAFLVVDGCILRPVYSPLFKEIGRLEHQIRTRFTERQHMIFR